MSAEPLLYVEPDDVRARLADLGLELSDLHSAIRFGYLARLACNENDPPAYVGVTFWARTLRGLRERLAPHGWRKLDAKLSMVLSPDETMAIVVSTGDDGTGVEEGAPKSRFPKGPATKAAVAANSAQGELFPLEQVLKRPPTTWVLLLSVEIKKDKTIIWSELSLPSSMDDEGKIGGWFERIVLPPIEDDDDRSRAQHDDSEPGPEFDVDVRRRAG